jgi:hypothetical protein
MIIICTNSGRFRAFRVSQSDTTVEAHNQISEIANEEFEDGPQRVGEITSDQAGRFRSDGTPGMAQGDDHGLEREEERRLISQVAGRIAAFVREEKTDDWKLAAPQTINARILEELDPSVLASLTANEKLDLTKLPTLEVGRRFGVIK